MLLVLNQDWQTITAFFDGKQNSLGAISGADCYPVLLPTLWFLVIALVISFVSSKTIANMTLALVALISLVSGLAIWVVAPGVNQQMQQLQVIASAHGANQLSSQLTGYPVMFSVLAGLAIFTSIFALKTNPRTAMQATSKKNRPSAIDLWDQQRP